MKFMAKIIISNFAIIQIFQFYYQNTCLGCSFFEFQGFPKPKMHVFSLKNV